MPVKNKISAIIYRTGNRETPYGYDKKVSQVRFEEIIEKIEVKFCNGIT